MNKPKTDTLSNVLHRGDPAADTPEVRPAQERRADLLARCATDTAPLAHERPRTKPRPIRALLLATTATAAIAGVAWLDWLTPSPQSSHSPAQVAEATPHATPVPTPGSGERKKPMEKIVKQVVPEAPPAPTANVNRTNIASGQLSTKERKRAPRSPLASSSTGVPSTRIANLPTKKTPSVHHLTTPEPHPSIPAEAQVERVIIVQDDTPVFQAPSRPTSVAIVMTDHSESVIVSHAAPPAAQL